MSTYVLVHGAWLGGWCWERVALLLQSEGHEVRTPDLPGHGEDRIPIPQITLESYAERVREVLDDSNEPVVLVGHSMAGVAVSRAAELRPEKVGTLVYLSAFLLRPGETLLERASADTESRVLPNMVVDEEEGHATLPEDALREIYYHDCPEADTARAVSRARPCPAAPFGEQLQITDERFGRIGRVYVECVNDRSMGSSTQREMHETMPCQQVMSMETGHTPFYAAPRELADRLSFLSGAAAGS